MLGTKNTDRHWEPENFENLKLENIKNDPWDMLNFCFHVYAQKLLFLCENYTYPVILPFIEQVPS